MSLLKKASIITTPTAYAEDFLYNIKPAGGLGDEIVTNGTFDTDSNWNKTGTWTISNNSATADADSTSQYLQQDFTITNGKIYEFNYVILQNTLNGNGAALSSFGGFGTVAISNEIGQHKTFITATNSSAAYVLKIGVSSTCTTGTIIIDNVSVKEVVDFSFDRNSTATRVNEDYLIEDVPYNLLTYSTDFTFWTQADTSTVQIEDSFDNSNNAYKVSVVSAGGFQTIRKTGLNVLGQQTFSIYAKKDTLNFTRILFGGVSRNFWVDLVNGTQGTTTGSYDSITITNAGNGFFRIVATFTATSPVTYIYLYPSTADGNVTQSSGSVIFQYAQLVKGDQPKNYLQTTDRLDIPRIDYTNGEPSILLEPSRTNQSLHSNDISQLSTITSGGATITTTGNYAISPDGTNTATRIVATTTGSEYAVATSTAASSTSGNYVGSVWLKSNNGQTQNVAAYTRNATVSYVTIYPYWQRYEVSGSTASNFFNIGSRVSVGSDASVDFLAWGMQIEHGDYATSLIPTSGSAVTRSADAATNAGNSDLISNSEGVLYAELARTSDDAIYELIAISSGVANYQNIVALGFDANNNEIWYRAQLGNTDLILVSAGAEVRPQNEFFKIAIKYKSGDSKVYLNGRMIDSTTTTASASVAFTRLDLAFYNIYNFYGKLKNVTVFKEALSDLELEKLTGYNNHELYMNYYNRLSYLGLAEEYNVESDINNYIL